MDVGGGVGESLSSFKRFALGSAQLNSSSAQVHQSVSQSVISLSMVLSTGQVHAARNREEEAASIRTGTIFINYCTTKENEETPAISLVELMQ